MKNIKGLFGILGVTLALNVTRGVSTAWAKFPREMLLSKMTQVMKAGGQPVAVFDLDETTVSSAKRKVLSMSLALKTEYAMFHSRWPNETTQLRRMLDRLGVYAIEQSKNQYDMIEVMARLGIYNRMFIEALEKNALPIYLTERFVREDAAIPGVEHWIKSIYRKNGRVVFVSSRYWHLQYQATVRNLKAQGLYREGLTQIILREKGEASLPFKARAFQAVQVSLGTRDQVFMVAENEPENMNLMMQQFQSAIGVFVRGAILNTRTPLKQNSRLYRIDDYLD